MEKAGEAREQASRVRADTSENDEAKGNKRKRDEHTREREGLEAGVDHRSRISKEKMGDTAKSSRDGVEELLRSMLQATRTGDVERLEAKELHGLQLKSVEYGRISCTFQVMENMIDTDEEFHAGGISALVCASEKLALSTMYSPCPKASEHSIGILDCLPEGSKLYVLSMVVCSERMALVTTEVRNASTSRLLVHGRSMYPIGKVEEFAGKASHAVPKILSWGAPRLTVPLAPVYKLVSPAPIQFQAMGPSIAMTTAASARPPSSPDAEKIHVVEVADLPVIPPGVRRMSCCGHPRRHHPKHYCPNIGSSYPGYPKEKSVRRRPAFPSSTLH